MTPITHPGERGSMTELAMVRLADEGVPIRALVRVFRRPFSEVESLLKSARADARIIDLPAADWPADSRRANRMPTITPVRGEATEDFILTVRQTFRLAPTASRLLANLIWRGRASKADLYSLSGTEAEPKIIDVYICAIRRELSLYQVQIETVWGWGYALSEPDRLSLIQRLQSTASASEDAAAAIKLPGHDLALDVRL